MSIRSPRGLLGMVSGGWGVELADDLAVEVAGETYTQTVPWAPASPLNGWLAGLPRRP